MEPVGSPSTDSTLPPPVVPDPVLATSPPRPRHTLPADSLRRHTLPAQWCCRSSLDRPTRRRRGSAPQRSRASTCGPCCRGGSSPPHRSSPCSACRVGRSTGCTAVRRGRCRSCSLSILAGVVAAIAVLVWTYAATENARRLIAPALTNDPPDPWRAVSTWALPMLFVASASAVVAVLSSTLNTPDENPSSIPLAVAVLSVLLVGAVRVLAVPVPVTGRPSDRWAFRRPRSVDVGAGRARRGRCGDGRRSARRWGGRPDRRTRPDVGRRRRGRGTVRHRRAARLAGGRIGRGGDLVRGGAPRRCATDRGATHRSRAASGPRLRTRRAPSSRRRISSSADVRGEVRQIPGSRRAALRRGGRPRRAGAARAWSGPPSWSCSCSRPRDGIVLPSQTDRAWETVDRLYGAARIVGLAVTVLAALWTFVAVFNVRLATGARRNPLLAAAAWPASFVAVWVLAGRIDDHSSVGQVVLTLLAAVGGAVRAVPPARADRRIGRCPPHAVAHHATCSRSCCSSTSKDSSRSPTRPTRSRASSSVGSPATSASVALVLLLSTLAVTEACRSIAGAAPLRGGHAQRPGRATPRGLSTRRLRCS